MEGRAELSGETELVKVVFFGYFLPFKCMQHFYTVLWPSSSIEFVLQLAHEYICNEILRNVLMEYTSLKPINRACHIINLTGLFYIE